MNRQDRENLAERLGEAPAAPVLQPEQIQTVVATAVACREHA